MHAKDLLDHRAAELIGFFKRRFGREWKTQVSSRIGFALSPLRKRDTHLFKAEDLARSLGFTPVADEFLPAPLERNFCASLSHILEPLHSVKFSDTLGSVYTLSEIVLEWLQHKAHRRLDWSDVLPPETLEIIGVDTRTISPAVPYRKSWLQAALDHPVVEPPRVRQNGTGGQTTPRDSLSGPRAEQKVTRAELWSGWEI